MERVVKSVLMVMVPFHASNLSQNINVKLFLVPETNGNQAKKALNEI